MNMIMGSSDLPKMKYSKKYKHDIPFTKLNYRTKAAGIIM